MRCGRAVRQQPPFDKLDANWCCHFARDDTGYRHFALLAVHDLHPARPQLLTNSAAFLIRTRGGDEGDLAQSLHTRGRGPQLGTVGIVTRI